MKKVVLRNLTKFTGKHLCQALGLQFFEKEALAQVLSCEFSKISKNAFFAKHLWTTDSDQKTIGFLMVSKGILKIII